ncbi:helical backbone metal receptor [Catenulispora rubra]|uniref:helical backbone metal receptor n=1 Tax=Catenulispora rubra TaxID=280293 RepID=UPI00189206E3|nr:helical backbone metal receptor [Catenulispora rubra]
MQRVVSLVPSLTEAIATTAPRLLVGATAWCTHPADLDVERIGGTKNPDVRRIVALAPDLVVANEEENRPADLDALREAGVSVLVTQIRTLDEAFRELDRMLTVGCGLDRPGWLDAAEAAWAAVAAELGPPPSQGSDSSAAAPAPSSRSAVIPIWRRPWMVLGRDTFAGDVLARLGVRNVYSDHAERYPKIPLPELLASGAELVVLPDEPYAFSISDGPEAFPGLPAALVSGRHLTWYGPSLAEAPDVLRRQLRSGRSAHS